MVPLQITGFSGNSYFDPLPVYQIKFSLQVPFKPARVYQLTDGKAIPFVWKSGTLTATLNELRDFETVVMDR